MLRREKSFRESYFEEQEAARVARNELRAARKEVFRDKLRLVPPVLDYAAADEDDTDDDLPELESQKTDSGMSGSTQENSSEAKRRKS